MNYRMQGEQFLNRRSQRNLAKILYKALNSPGLSPSLIDGIVEEVAKAIPTFEGSNSDAFLNHFNYLKTWECPTCKSSGFPSSVLPNQCEFCDGTFGGVTHD